jgi:ribosomal-protein-alanine N-acetyltransferase
VRLALAEAFGAHRLWRVEATSRPENPASVRVLQANGFVQFGHARRCFQLGETWFDLLHFEVHADRAQSL